MMHKGKLSGEFLYNHDKVRMWSGYKNVESDGIPQEVIYNIQNHVSDFYSLVYIAENDAVVYIDEKIRDVKRNSVIFADRRSVIKVFSKYDYAKCYEIILDFKPELFGKIGTQDVNFNKILTYVVNGNYEDIQVTIPEIYSLRDEKGIIKFLFENALAEYKTRKLNYIQVIKNNVQNILIEIARSLECFDNSMIKAEIVQQIVDYTEIHYKENITLELLSKMFYCSGAYITKMFKREMGMSYAEYLRQRRIYQASNMLSDSNMKINEIVKNVGFSDVVSFRNAFKKYVGLTPKEYRNQTRNAKKWFIGMEDFRFKKNMEDE